jgi:hypothetical protein
MAFREIKYASSLDWTSPVRVYDKVDGSLVTLYQYKGEWFVATKGMADGSGSLPTAGSPVSENDDEITSNNVVDAAQAKEPSTFSELFWSVWNCRGYKLPGGMDADCRLHGTIGSILLTLKSRYGFRQVLYVRARYTSEPRNARFKVFLVYSTTLERISKCVTQNVQSAIQRTGNILPWCQTAE